MNKKLDLIKQIRGVSTYSNAIDSKFTELMVSTEVEEEEAPTVEKFFEMYETLFFDIPPNGEINSHEYLVVRSTEYLGGNIIDPEKLALIEEINSLRQQLLDINTTIFNVDKLTK